MIKFIRHNDSANIKKKKNENKWKYKYMKTQKKENYANFSVDSLLVNGLSPSTDQRSGTASQRLCGRRSYHCSRFGET